VTNERKKQIWESIASAVNAVNAGERKTVEQVKKRWEDLTTSVKRKERQARQNEIKRLKVTGNGNLPDDQDSSELLGRPVAPATSDMSSPERLVADVLGPEVFLGISGGMDTLETLWKKDECIPFFSSQESKFEKEQNSTEIHVANYEDQPHCSAISLKDSQDEVEVKETVVSKRRRKKTLADVQLENRPLGKKSM